MKRELKLNFGELRLVKERAAEFREALTDIEEAAAFFDEVLGEQESEAAAVLVERHQEMEEDIRYFQDILEQLEKLVEGYIDKMEGFIMPRDESQMVLVDRNDIWWNLKQIGGNISAAKSVAYGQELSYYSGIDTTPFPPQIHEGMSPEAQSAAWERYHRELEESRNRKANYDQLERFCSGIAGRTRQELENLYEDLERLYKEHVVEYENTDDAYKKKAGELYDACTGFGERVWDIGSNALTFLLDTIEGTRAAAWDFIGGILGLAYTYLKVEAAIKVAVVTVPFGITPQWVKDTGKEVIRGLQNIAGILRNPGRALASLGQQVTDTVEEKGIPYAASYVIADVVISILVDKGIGKLRGVDQADDVAGVADDIGDVTEALEQVDDVADITKAADKVDDVAGAGGLEGGTGSQFQEVFDLADNYTLSDDTFNNHILDRHGPNSTYGNKSHFNADFDIREGIDSIGNCETRQAGSQS